MRRGVPGFDGGDSRDDQGRDPVGPPVMGDVPGREPLASALTDSAVRTTAATARAAATMTAARRSSTADWPGRCRSALNRQISVADPMTSARTPRPTATTPRL
jgi:hypothetical protein